MSSISQMAEKLKAAEIMNSDLNVKKQELNNELTLEKKARTQAAAALDESNDKHAKELENVRGEYEAELSKTVKAKDIEKQKVIDMQAEAQRLKKVQT